MCPVLSSPGVSRSAIPAVGGGQPAAVSPAVIGGAALVLLAGCGGGALKDVNLGHRAVRLRRAQLAGGGPLAWRGLS